MRKFIIFVLAIIFIVGCFILLMGCSENPILTTTDKPIENISICIIAEYGYCDSTGCYGESIILFNKTNPCIPASFVDSLTTIGEFIITPLGLVLPFNRYLFMYNASCESYISLSENYRTFFGMGLDTTFNLNFNTTYFFDYGKNN